MSEELDRLVNQVYGEAHSKIYRVLNPVVEELMLLRQEKANLETENERLHLDPQERACYNDALATAEMERDKAVEKAANYEMNKNKAERDVAELMGIVMAQRLKLAAASKTIDSRSGNTEPNK